MRIFPGADQLAHGDRDEAGMDAQLAMLFAGRRRVRKSLVFGRVAARWLSRAAGDHLRNELLGAALEVWQAEQGPFTDDELDAAARVLGVSGSDTRRAS